ncbi:HEAT repeat domain-containing protein [Streptomyces sp. ATCC51928]|uniref:HEAT repeat domain-containing protein n=1 Tax=Streptomyces caviscabies TaxID=90079 RepID=A0ABW2MJP6_9ACTN|nr:MULTISPECIES: HEAT repeat domain-containing protein [unclassified Streptomyces]MDX3504746.1 HEAT repeat domain-containing protein [Streptomyces sp. ATCC51928]MDX5524420.1 HEAT repeat domain-containing protein [Streptomyces sp. DE06-01C]
MVPIDTNGTPHHTRLAGALSAEDPSVRLKAAMAIGSAPDPALLETLVERCGVEPDLFVRDTLSWALMRYAPEVTLPRIRRELDSASAQARSQAMHTLSKIGDKAAWDWITRDMLHDVDDETARTAWRVAVSLVPEAEERWLTAELVKELGRGNRSLRMSLSRALVDLGDVVEPALKKAAAAPDPAVAEHAAATEQLLRSRRADLEAAAERAKRVAAPAEGALER